ncbi:hypothetical protein C7999DRAFT_28086 [Corynascus novoguineensis]|uniref:Uncharacterized protein n=1 Tax=Corynascus novoguineensis TaxID=1126955 RepID=A0AAN7HIJ9_9PEZI|nr:hypothetical protein C7999DRAFT_28086 [Corynascus novoguineensis]
MATSSSSSIFAANIPSITALRNALDYGDPHLPRCAAFYDDTRAFRKKFKTSRGVPGADLHDWKSRDGQAALTEMTVAYLEKEGNGMLFWPDDKSSDNYNKYQYSKDHVRIKQLVKQLFFRLNQQQFRNKKYKHKAGPNNKSADSRGDSETTAIDIDAIVVESIRPLTDPAVKFSEPSPAEVSRFDRPYGGQAFGSQEEIQLGDTDDVYAVPASPPRMRQFESTNEPSKVKHAPTSANESPQDRPSKRPKLQQRSSGSARDDGPSVKGPTGQTWKSHRARRTVRREGYHGLDVLNEFIDPALEGSRLHTSDLPNQASSPRVSKTTFRSPVDASTDDPVRPDEVCGKAQEDRTLLPELEARSSPPRSSPGNEDDPNLDRDQAYLGAVHVALTPSHPGNLGVSGNADEQPKQPLVRSDISPTPGPGGGASEGCGEGGSRSGGKFSIEFIYRIVLSRTPKTVTERWTPQGRFQDKTLAQLLKELPFRDNSDESQGLIFTIDSPCMTTTERIPNNDEGGFLSLKGYINREIRAWLARQRRLGVETQPRLLVDILIERMTDEKEQELDGLEGLELQW